MPTRLCRPRRSKNDHDDDNDRRRFDCEFASSPSAILARHWKGPGAVSSHRRRVPPSSSSLARRRTSMR